MLHQIVMAAGPFGGARLGLLLCGAILFACDAGPPDSSSGLSSAPIGVELVSTFGCVACEGTEALGSPTGLSVTDDGDVVVATISAPFVTVIDPAGGASAFGTPGDGPSEIPKMPVGVGVLSDGSIAVASFDGAITGYGRGGEPIGRLKPAAGVTYSATASPNGRWLVVLSASDRGLVVERLAPGGGSSATIPLRDVNLGLDSLASGYSVALAVDDSGTIALGDGSADTYQVWFMDAAGDVESLSLDVPKRERTAEELDELRAATSGMPGDFEPNPLVPYFGASSFDFDDRGRLWVNTLRGDGSGSMFDIFTRYSEHLGTVSIPDRVYRFDVSSDVLATAGPEAEFGTTVVRIWRVDG